VVVDVLSSGLPTEEGDKLESGCVAPTGLASSSLSSMMMGSLKLFEAGESVGVIWTESLSALCLLCAAKAGANGPVERGVARVVDGPSNLAAEPEVRGASCL
jgi:hypothetical protein